MTGPGGPGGPAGPAGPAEPEGAQGAAEPVEPAAAGDRPPAHEASGLELARALARATSRSTAPPAGTGRGRAPGAAGTADAAVSGTGRRPAPRVRGDLGARRRGGLSGARPDERDPQGIDASLGRLVSDRGWAVDLRVHGVLGRWEELVGDDVAAHCTPESFADGRLVVRTDSTAWATQLRMLAPTIVRRLNQELGHGTVTLIEVLGPHLPGWTKGRRSVRGGRGPRDTYG